MGRTTQSLYLRKVYVRRPGAGLVSRLKVSHVQSQCVCQGSYQQALERICFLAHSGHWPDSVPGICRLRASFPWLAVGSELLSAPEATTRSGSWPPFSQAAMSGPVPEVWVFFGPSKRLPSKSSKLLNS